MVYDPMISDDEDEEPYYREEKQCKLCRTWQWILKDEEICDACE